jgi:hypothetical protein
MPQTLHRIIDVGQTLLKQHDLILMQSLFVGVASGGGLVGLGSMELDCSRDQDLVEHATEERIRFQDPVEHFGRSFFYHFHFHVSFRFQDRLIFFRSCSKALFFSPLCFGGTYLFLPRLYFGHG